MPKRKGSHFKKKRPPEDPILAYFERFNRKQIIGMLLIADAAIGIRNIVLQELDEHLTDDQRERLNVMPYQELVQPMTPELMAAMKEDTTVTPLVEVQSGAFTASDD